MYETWNVNFDPKRVLKAVVLMPPCFLGDQDIYNFSEVPEAGLKRKAIMDLAEIFALEMWEDTIADLLSQEGEEGVFTQKYYRSTTGVLCPPGQTILTPQTPPLPVTPKNLLSTC